MNRTDLFQIKKVAANFCSQGTDGHIYTQLQDLLFNILLTTESDSVYVRKKKPSRKAIMLCLQLSLLICESHL